MGKHRIPYAFTIGALIAFNACQPLSPTAARDQLGRNAEGTISFTLPVADTSFLVSELLGADLDTITTPSGLLGIVQSDTVRSAIGEELEFNGVGFDQFSFSYIQMLETQEASTSVNFPAPPPGVPSNTIAQAPGAPNDTIQFTTPGGSQVLNATVASGWIVRTMVNNTICSGTLSVSLLDDVGAVVVALPDVALTPGEVLTDSTDASGATVSGFVAINSSATFGACVPGVNDSVATNIIFRPMQLASVTLQNVTENFSETYDVLATETRLNSIDTVDVSSGSVSVTVSNRLPLQMSFDIVLNGFLDPFGNPLRDSLTIAAAVGDGSYVSGTLSFDLTDVTMIPALATAIASGTVTAAQAVLTPTVVTDAVLAGGAGDIIVRRLSGDLDPGSTPELALAVEEFEELSADDIDFGDLEDAIQSSTLNDGTIALTISNSADIPVELSNFTVGVVELDAQGQIPRDGGGNPIYAADCSGLPTVLVAAPGLTTLPISRGGTTSVSLGASSVVDCLVHNLIDDDRVALLAVGTATAGDGSQATITRQDEVVVAIDVVVGLDLTIPSTGVTFTRNQTADGLDLSDTDAADLTSRLVSASLVAVAENSTPFMVDIEIAIVPDSVGDNVDIFTRPDAVLLDMVSLSNAPVDGNGRPTNSVTDNVSFAIEGQDVRVVLGRIYTAGIRMRLSPRSDGGTRGAIRPQDGIGIDASVEIEVRRGSS